jgi:hypothetical protein
MAAHHRIGLCRSEAPRREREQTGWALPNEEIKRFELETKVLGPWLKAAALRARCHRKHRHS